MKGCLDKARRRLSAIGLSTLTATLAATVSAVNMPPPLSDPDAGQAAPLGPAFYGMLPGESGVSAAGNATFRLPLSLPPGINGLAPDLALSYNSNVSNGVIGAGWFLSGDSVSRIHRCPATLSQNGRIAAVELSASDRFCLDGQQLLAVAGQYGGDGTEYRTEADRIARVESHGSAGDGPAWWSVRTRDGREMRYGATEDSRAQAGGRSLVRQWALSEVLDGAGNHYQLYYDEDAEEGIQLLTRVAFTGNQYTGTLPASEVSLEYQSRSDNPLHFRGGARVRPHPRRLAAIAVRHADRLLHRYQFTYEEVGAGRQSRLLRMVRCDGEGHCQEPIELDWWDDGRIRHVRTEEPMPYSGLSGDIYGTAARRYTLTYSTSPRWHDLNADGVLDYVHVVPSGSGNYPDNRPLEVRMSGPEGYSENTWTSQLWGAPNTYIWGDFNGDGGTDIASPDYRTSPDSLLVASWTGSGFDTRRWALTERKGTRLYRDVDGDQLPDLLVIHRRRIGNANHYEVWVSPNTGSGFGPENRWFSTVHRDIQVIDLTGDGLVDILADDRYLHAGNGSGFGSARDLGSIGYYKTSSYTDFNGDGLADRHTRNPDGSCCRVEYNTGAGFEYAGETADFPLQDIDGNGLLDAYKRFIDRGRTYVRYELAETGEPGVTEPIQYKFSGKNEFFFQAADINGDGAGDYALARYHMCRVWTTPSGTYAYPCEARNHYLGLSQNRPTRLLKAIRQGLGREISFHFRPLTDSTIYTRGDDATLPVQDVQDATWVVSRMSRLQPDGSWVHTDYRYRGLRRDLGGRGLLGFASIESRPSNRNLFTRTLYSRSFPTGSQPVTVEVLRKADGHPVRVTNHRYETRPSAGGSVFAFRAETVKQQYDLDSGEMLSSETIRREVDGYANVVEEEQLLHDVALDRIYGSRIENTWRVDDSRAWRTAQLVRSKTYRWIDSEHSAGPPRVVARAYDDATGLLRQEQIQPEGSSDESLTLELVRDLFGNVIERRRMAHGAAPRIERTEWDASGRSPVRQVNPLGHVTTFEWDGALGLKTSETDPNGLTTRWSYDSFGRLLTESRPGEGLVRYAYWHDHQRNARGSRYHVDIETAGEGARRIHYDFFGRVVREQYRGFHGDWIFVDTEYDENGRLWRQSEPYRQATETPAWTITDYDELGRPVAINAADSARSSNIRYAGLNTEHTNAAGFTRTEQHNAIGLLIATIDEAGTLSTMEYDAWGNRVRVTSAALSEGESQVDYEYDVLGRLIAIRDPNYGHHHYWYNAHGQRVREETPGMRVRGVQTEYEYDALGRLALRREAEGETRWHYDHSNSGTLGIGRVHRIEQPAYTSVYTYAPHGHGKLTDQTITISSSAVYHSAWRYDTTGRLLERVYPGANVERRSYNSTGFLERLSLSGVPYYQVIEMDSRNRVTSEWQGDGSLSTRRYEATSGRIVEASTTSPREAVQDLAYGYDALGNMQWREDRMHGLREDFSYDSLSRLRSARVSNSVAAAYEFDPAGRLLLKSDTAGAYAYGDSPFHGVAATSQGAEMRSYRYDDNGNLTAADDALSITWSSFNKPTRISMGGIRYEFAYGPDRRRYRKAKGAVVTHYIGDSFERDFSGPTQISRLMLRAYGRLVMIQTSHSGGDEQMYLHGDHQGSITAVTRPEDGAVLERFSYDAWGKRRNPLDWQSPASATLNTNRGYTGHEHFDDVGLIHMNGRIYNPTLARMLSPDPVTQQPDNAQNYDRYAYAFNNPLKYVDPTGMSALESVMSPMPNIKVPFPQISSSLAGFTIKPKRSFGTSVVEFIDTRIGGQKATWDDESVTVIAAKNSAWQTNTRLSPPILTLRGELSEEGIVAKIGDSVSDSYADVSDGTATTYQEELSMLIDDAYTGELTYTSGSNLDGGASQQASVVIGATGASVGCVAAFSVCTSTVVNLGRASLALEFYDIFRTEGKSSPVGIYSASVSASREAYSFLIRTLPPAARLTMDWVGLGVSFIVGAIPDER